MESKDKGFKLPRLPIKEVMIGEGLLSLSVGLLLWLTSYSFAPSVYNLFHDLSLDQMRAYVSLAGQGIFAFGALNVLLPVLFVLISRLIQEKQTKLSEK